MNDGFVPGLCIGLAIGGFMGSIIMAIAWDKDATNWRSCAVKADKAEFYLDANNDRQWRWKP